MKTLLFVAAAAAVLVSCGRGSGEPQVTVENAVVTVPAVPGGPGAAYFMLRSNSEGTRLVSLSAPGIQRVEFHATMESGGMSGMQPLAPGDLTFSASAPLTFEPGGKHAMLFGVDPAMRPGGKVRLTFTFEGAPPATVEADVRGPGQGHAGR